LPKPLDLPSRQRPWISLVVSAALHALVLALAVRLSREPVPEPQKDHATRPSEPKRQVEMVYLQPPPPAPPKVVPPAPPPPPPKPPPPPAQQPPVPPPQAMAPPPEKAQPKPEPDANAPPEAKRSEGEEPTDAEKKPPGSAVPAPVATMESEARRIFGRQHQGPAPGAGPRASRPMEAYLPDHPEKCIPQQRPQGDSAGAPQFGVVLGRIFRKDNGRPLAGAHLQMLGTPYVTFTDGNGEYQFRFDLSLVDNCRTQYVRVTAAGYESRLLVLVVGPNVRSDDVVLKKK
jgi:hypothetical protein